MSVPQSWVEDSILRLRNSLMAIRLRTSPANVDLRDEQSAAARERRWRVTMGDDVVWADDNISRLMAGLRAQINGQGDSGMSRISSAGQVESLFRRHHDGLCKSYNECRAMMAGGGARVSSSVLPSVVGPTAEELTASQTHQEARNKGKQRANSGTDKRDTPPPAPPPTPTNPRRRQKPKPKRTMDEDEKERPTPEEREAHWNEYIYRYDEEGSSEPGDLYKAMMSAMGETSGRTANKKKNKKRRKFGEDFIAPNGHTVKEPLDTADLSAMIHEVMADIGVTNLADTKLQEEASQVAADLSKTAQESKGAEKAASGEQATSSAAPTSSSAHEPDMSKLADILIRAAAKTSAGGQSTSAQSAAQSPSAERDFTARLAALSTKANRPGDAKTTGDAPAITFTPASPTSAYGHSSPRFGEANMQTTAKTVGGETPPTSTAPGESVRQGGPSGLKEISSADFQASIDALLGRSAASVKGAVDKLGPPEPVADIRGASSSAKATDSASKKADSTSAAGTSTKGKGKGKDKTKAKAKGKAKATHPSAAVQPSGSSTAAGASTSHLPERAAYRKAPDENGFEELVAGDLSDPHKDITDMDELVRIAKEHMEPF